MLQEDVEGLPCRQSYWELREKTPRDFKPSIESHGETRLAVSLSPASTMLYICFTLCHRTLKQPMSCCVVVEGQLCRAGAWGGYRNPPAWGAMQSLQPNWTHSAQGENLYQISCTSHRSRVVFEGLPCRAGALGGQRIPPGIPSPLPRSPGIPRSSPQGRPGQCCPQGPKFFGAAPQPAAGRFCEGGPLPCICRYSHR